MSALHVACASEGRRYTAHTAAMLHSLLVHNPGQTVHVHYLCGPDLPRRSRDALAGMVESHGGSVSFLEVPDESVAGLPTEDFTRKATWYRILLPELRPELDRLVYLDSDLIVLDSLAPISDLDLQDRYLAAVTNVFQSDHVHRPGELGLSGPEVYFNAGVMVMNLELMRRDGCTKAMLEYGVTHSPDWRDQDALNVVLGSKRLPLEPRWNCMNAVLLFPWSEDVFGAEAVAEARRNPAVRHFEGPESNKPWHFLCEHDQRELYLRHRRETPWPRLRPEGLTPANVLRRTRRAVSA